MSGPLDLQQVGDSSSTGFMLGDLTDAPVVLHRNPSSHFDGTMRHAGEQRPACVEESLHITNGLVTAPIDCRNQCVPVGLRERGASGFEVI